MTTRTKPKQKKPKRKKPPRSPLTRLVQDGPRTSAEVKIFRIVLFERTALVRRQSLELAAVGQRMRVRSR